MTPGLQLANPLVAAAATAIRRSVDALIAMQHEQGYWWGELTADTTLESDYILLQLWLHPPRNGIWNPPHRDLIERAVRSILDRQLPGGGFNIYPHGPAEISATVKAYFALKLAGLPYDGPELSGARARILELGGIHAANSYVKVNLSLFGLYPRELCPSIPPEMMLLPGNFIYQMSSWTRAIVVPLAIVHAANPRRPVPSGFTLEELFVPKDPPRRSAPVLSWRNLFLQVDRMLKLWEKYGSRRLRDKAVRRAGQWFLERTRYSDGLGAIYPPMMYSIMALDVLGYPPGHPDRAEAERQFEGLMVDDGRRFFFQPCFSPVWDTAIVAFALGEAGIAPRDSLRRAADWLLSKEVRRRGDWSVKRPETPPSGWYFEFANEFYPDIDDSAMVLLALSHARASHELAHNACVQRALHWLLEMQSKDGGWAAFDVDNDWRPLSHVPFADHNAMLDPTCPDITGRVLEGLIASGISRNHPAIRRGVDYLVRNQEQDGSWYGRWGVDYVYGTFLALRGLRAAGVSSREAFVLRAGEWLRSIQNADGGWGESCASYDNNSFTAAPSTPSQTAWAVLGLLASGDDRSISLQKGIEYLLETQRRDGTWEEDLATGTGFPRVFYLTYHLYRNSFPLLALAVYARTKGEAGQASRPGVWMHPEKLA
ncbi:MAG: squalene--hopene cyclase [Acidobacteria bacterium]|nr:squalene--hopene cyclase [Acidobacteriota bacterium]MBI3280241.1 squalene--hopene cyclase [Acidobacteriota bacterium]